MFRTKLGRKDVQKQIFDRDKKTNLEKKKVSAHTKYIPSNILIFELVGTSTIGMMDSKTQYHLLVERGMIGSEL